MVAGPAAVLVHNDDPNEIFYRGMSEREFQGLGSNGEIVPKYENFVTQSRDYVERLRNMNLRRGGRSAEKYTRLMRYEMQAGTREALIAAGRGSGSNITAIKDAFGIDLEEIGSSKSHIHVKLERGDLNFGLRSGSADVFNSRIIGCSEVPWE